MKKIDNKAFFWEKFDENEKPINPKECQIIFNPKVGGELNFLLNLDEEYNENKYKKNIDKMYGIAKGGKPFTLINIKVVEPPLVNINTRLELTEIKYSIEYIYYGGWINLESQIEMMHIRYSYLELWFNQMQSKRPFHDNEKIISQITVNKESLKGNTSEYNLLFNINNTGTQNIFNNKIITFESKNSLAIYKTEKFEIKKSLDLAFQIKSFFEIMTFYSDNKIFIEELKLSLSNGEIVELLFKQDDYIEEKEMSHIDFLLRYKDIKDNFVQVLNNWIENYDNNKNEYGAFCNVISDKDSKFNIYTHYFQLISALEGYFNNNFKENIEFRKKLNQLIIKSEIKTLFPLNSSIHQSISNTIFDMRNDLAHSKKVIEINNRVKSSFEYIKIVTLLLMMKDVSLNHNNISKHILDFDLNSIEKNLIESFSKTGK